MGAVRRIILAFGVILISRCVAAQTGVIPVYACTLPGTQAKTSGMKSTNHQMGVIPSCTVTVYLTGTQTIATTTPQSPFTANTDGSIPAITAATGQGYDVVMSGGISPNTYPQPYTITDVFVGTASGSANISNQANGIIGVSTGPAAITAQSPLSVSGGNVKASGAFSAKNMASIGPRYDVTQFGAKGDGSTDDTAAIQAAYNACWNSGSTPYGGVVEFPGAKTYMISSTINTFDGCNTEGVNQNVSAGGGPTVQWLGTGATQGTTFTSTAFNLEANNGTNLPCNGAICTSAAFPHIPAGVIRPYQVYAAVFTVSQSLSLNQWLQVTGCTSSLGRPMNNLIGQVAYETSTSVVMIFPWPPTTLGSGSDSCVLTTVNVMFAMDQSSQNTETFTNLGINGTKSGLTSTTQSGIGIYAGSRLDSGNGFFNVQVQNNYYANWYIAGGGLNMKWTKGWRCDGGGQCIYWRVGGPDNFSLSDGTMASGELTQANTGMLEIDGAGSLNYTHVAIRNVKIEPTGTPPSNTALFYLIDTPNSSVEPQFFISTDSMEVIGFPYPDMPAVLIMSPQSSAALSLSLKNTSLGQNNFTAAERWIGVPALARDDNTGVAGFYSNFSYNNSILSTGLGGTIGSSAIVDGSLGDFQVSQLWQHKVFAPSFLESDTAFAALPNATTLFKGQIIAPPVYWQANSQRMAIQSVDQSGTTGTLNGGSTTCTNPSGTTTCSSQTDLERGEYVSINGNQYLQITSVDATTPSQTVVSLASNPGTFSSPLTLSFSPPLLGNEMQLPVKASAAPTSGTWVQGDVVWNSAATGGGTFGWQCTASGTPGTWVALTSTSGSGSNVSVNGGATIASPNFNGTTPAAGANGINVTWQQSAGNVSGEIVGDGNSSHFLNGQGAFTAPSGSGVTLQTNSSSNVSQTLLNMETSTTNSVGLIVTPSNPSGGIEKFEVTGSSYTGNAATATALAASPTNCISGQAPTGINASGTVQNCTAYASALANCSDESTTFTPVSGNCYFVTASVSTATPAANSFVLFTATTSSAGTFALTGTTIADGGNCSSYISGTTLTLTSSQTVTVKSDGTNIRATCTAAGGSGTVTDGAGVSTANEVAVSTTTPHVQTYSATLPTAAVPAFTGDATNTAGSLAMTVGKVNGASLPASKAFVGTNSSSQIVDASTILTSPSVFGISEVDNSTISASAGVISVKSGSRKWTCQTGLGDGLNAIASGTYLQSFCYNDTGSTVTITGLKCLTDNAGTSTMNASGHTLGSLLTGAVTCTASWAAGTQSANVSLTNGDWINFTFVADGTSKQTSWEVSGTY